MDEENKISVLRVFIKAISDDERTPLKIREEIASKSAMLDWQLDEVELERIAKIFEVQFNVALDVGNTVKKTIQSLGGKILLKVGQIRITQLAFKLSSRR